MTRTCFYLALAACFGVPLIAVWLSDRLWALGY